MEKSNEYIEKRIKWKADKYSLPTEYSQYFNEIPQSNIEKYNEILSGREIGLPVLFFETADKKWTILGTKKVLWNDGLTIKDLSLQKIDKITSGPLDRMRNNNQSNLEAFKKNDLKKSEMADLAVYDIDGNLYYLHANKGADLFSLWNILLMAVKLSKKST